MQKRREKVRKENPELVEIAAEHGFKVDAVVNGEYAYIRKQDRDIHRTVRLRVFTEFGNIDEMVFDQDHPDRTGDPYNAWLLKNEYELIIRSHYRQVEEWQGRDPDALEPMDED